MDWLTERCDLVILMLMLQAGASAVRSQDTTTASDEELFCERVRACVRACGCM
jgi:hypothetical protein